MIRHLSRPTRALGAAALAAAAFFISFLPSAARAQSVEIFINSVFVASPLSSATFQNGYAVGNLSENGYPVGCYNDGAVPPRFQCTITGHTDAVQNGWDISNYPQINFESDGKERCSVAVGGSGLANSNPQVSGTVGYNVCNDQVYLCAQVGLGQVTGSVSVDEVEFEIFQFVNGANPLDPTSTPPLKTFFIDNPGVATVAATDTPSCDTNGSCELPDFASAYCVLWDGSQNVQGTTGKINGSYGVRVTVQTNQVGQSGNITITQVRAYPSGATLDSLGNTVSQQNIQVNVTDVHVISSSPTVVGQITGVSAEPYNFTYRLSKTATMWVRVLSSSSPFSLINSVVPGLQRTGEGTLSVAGAVPIVNGDSWNGRDANGNVLLPGNYLVVFQANDTNQYSPGPGGYTGPGSTGVFDTGVSDLSNATTVQIGLDPLQITDIRVQPLLGGSTSLAVLSYQLTEPATVYVDIYPPGTQFCDDASGNPALSDVNSAFTDPDNEAAGATTPPKYFYATTGPCPGTPGIPASPVAPIRSISQMQTARTPVITFWNGADVNGNLQGDGDYVFVIYASLPSQAGLPYNNLSGNNSDKRVWTSLGKSGFIPVIRGLVGVTQVTPTSTVIGSSPAIAGLSPFTFSYQLSRDAIVSLKIYDAAGAHVVKTIVNQETRPGLFNNVETWSDGNGDNGLAVASGTYLVMLTATDGTFPVNVTTTTALFPVDNFRITDVSLTPLLSGTSAQATLTYQLSQEMMVAWNIYPAGSIINNGVTTWPPCPNQNPPGACVGPSVTFSNGTPASPIVTFSGARAGRLKITESWDGRDANGLQIPDGNYVYTLTALSTTTPQYFAADHVEGALTIARGAIFFTSFNVTPTVPQLFNSSNTIELDPFSVQYVLTRQSSVTISILNTSIPAQVMRTVVAGGLRDGGILNTDVWDGRDNNGNLLPSISGGTPYLVRVTAVDVSAELSNPSTAQQTVLYDPLRIYDLAVTPNTGGGAIIAYQVSEPMKVAIKIYKPGTGFDGLGNPLSPDSVSLVSRIVGTRPSRTDIKETWNGLNLQLQKVPDGPYKFLIVGSTDPSAIDTNTGNILAPSELADDRTVDDLPVAAGASGDPLADFEANTFVYPNPVTGPSGTFSIYTPYQANISLKLYTIAGQLVLSTGFTNVPPSWQNGPQTFVWNKVNQSGRAVARGLYYAVIRIDDTLGGTNTLQTVKKVLVP